MKKKVLITMTSMFIGGAERSLIGMLEKFDYEKYDVFLFLYRHEGELMKFIPEKVHILPEMKEYSCFDRPIIDLLKTSLWKYGFMRILSKIELQFKYKKNEISLWKTLQYTTKYIIKLLPKIPGEYDIALGFLGYHMVLCDKVSAKRKVGWIHTDYSILFPDLKMEKKVFDKLDYIVNVSDDCTRTFLSFFPEYKKKAITIENLLPVEFVRKESEKDKKITEFEDKNRIYFCSTGRFATPKNFVSVPIICKKLVENGFNICWYLIGYGGMEKEIREAIKENNMEKHVIILGKKVNPYPYIKNCDYYIQPSLYEGKAVAVREAQALCRPVIITDFATSRNQVENGIDGIIVPLESIKCAEGIVQILKNSEIKEKLICNMKTRDYSNRNEIEKIYELIEG